MNVMKSATLSLGPGALWSIQAGDLCSKYLQYSPH